MRFKVRKIRRFSLSGIALLTLGGSMTSAASFAQTKYPIAQFAQATPADTKAFNEDIKTLDAFQDTLDLNKFEMTADEMLGRWQKKDPRKYSEIVANVCALLAFSNSRSQPQRALAQKYTLANLSHPERLLAPHYIGLIHDLSRTDENLKGEAWTRIRKERIQLWIAGWERIEREYETYKDFDEPTFVSIPVSLDPNDKQKQKAYEEEVAVNDRNNEIGNYKQSLTNLKLSFPKEARQFFIESYCRTSGDLNELRSLLNNSAIDRQAAADVFNEVSDGVRKHPAITLQESDLRK